MTASGADQNRYRLVLRAAPNGEHRLFLNFDLSIALDRSGQRPQTFLSRDLAQISNRTLPQLDVLFRLRDTDQVSSSGVAVVVTRDAAERAPLQFVRGHRFEKVLKQRQRGRGAAHRER